MNDTPTIAQLLAGAGIEGFEARILLAHALDMTRVQLITRSQECPAPEQVARAQALFARRAAGEPVAYLLGWREFHSLPFQVTPDVLIPRPETELLVELASERMASGLKDVADLGTGSGAIAITLAHLHPEARVCATDISPAALAVARANAEHNKVQVEFLQGSWTAPLQGRRFDLIVSNPPYIRADDPHLAQGDLRFEPQQALTANADGLSALRAIVEGAKAHLKSGGWLLMEHGYDQAAQMRDLLHRQGYAEAQSWRDLAGIERVTGARLPAA